MKRGFDWPRWQANAAQLSHKYDTMWSKDYAAIERKFGLNNVLYLR